jgi:SCY1-like protein 2
MLPVLDFSTVKNEVFPPIASTFSRTSSLAIKVRGLEAFCILCGGSPSDSDGLDDDLNGTVQPKQTTKSSILDKYTIQEKVVPSLKAIKTKEPSVMMAALKVFHQVGKVADTDFLALEVLPVLWGFSLGPLLNLQQFNEFMTVIKSLSTKIEKEQTRKLQELSSGGDSGGFQAPANSFSQSATDLTSPDTDGARNNFERLVLGKSAAPANGADADLWGGMDAEQAAPKRPGMSPALSWSMNNATGISQNSPNQLGFRSITPDQKLGSFPSLEPARQASPVVPSFPTMQPSSPTWNGANRPSPSMASLSGMAANAPMSNPTSLSHQTSNYSAFSIPPPPGGVGAANTIRSPSLNMNTTPAPFASQPQPQRQSQAPTKQGLDKYESLL